MTLVEDGLNDSRSAPSNAGATPTAPLIARVAMTVDLVSRITVTVHLTDLPALPTRLAGSGG